MSQPNQRYLLTQFTYEENTGVFFRNYKEYKGIIDSNGTPKMPINGKRFHIDKLIWKLMTNEEPEYIIHIDGDKRNMKWSNLKASNVKQKVKTT